MLCLRKWKGVGIWIHCLWKLSEWTVRRRKVILPSMSCGIVGKWDCFMHALYCRNVSESNWSIFLFKLSSRFLSIKCKPDFLFAVFSWLFLQLNDIEPFMLGMSSWDVFIITRSQYLCSVFSWIFLQCFCCISLLFLRTWHFFEQYWTHCMCKLRK
jgi:hypothetical protein